MSSNILIGKQDFFISRMSDKPINPPGYPHPDYPNGTPEFPYRKVFGYARVSTEEQDPQMQVAMLEKAGCDKVFVERVSALAKNRKEFNTMLRSLREGDMIVVWKLDRLGRQVLDIAELGRRIEKKGVELKSLTEQIDTSTPMGKAFFYLLAVFAQLERDMISERTKAGMAQAKAQGKQLGHQSKVRGIKKLKILLDIWLCELPLPKVAKKHGYKSHAIFQKYFPQERKAALAAMASTEDLYYQAMRERFNEIADQQGVSEKDRDHLWDDTV